MLYKIRQIKYSRLKEEERFFLDTIDGIEPFTSDDYPESIFWMKNNTVLLEEDYKSSKLWVNYTKIWSVLESKYGYDYHNVVILISDMIKNHTNLGSLKIFSLVFEDFDKTQNLSLDTYTSLGKLMPDRRTTIINNYEWKNINLIV